MVGLLLNAMDPSRKQTPQGPWRWDAEGLEQVAVAYGTVSC